MTNICGGETVAAIIFFLNAIWLARNRLRFQNVTTIVFRSISYIMKYVSLAGGSSFVVNFFNMQDFEIMKRFKVTIPS